MPTIEQNFEAAGTRHPDYENNTIPDGLQRKWIGGHWDDGHIQVDFVKSQGLQPGHRFIDVGCGSFRAGHLLVDFLDPANYFGIDANQSVMQAGYDKELSEEQRRRLPVGNLRASDRFNVNFGVLFDFGIAQSVFTHVSLNHMRLCFYRVAQHMKPGGKFYATFNERGKDFPIDGVAKTKAGQPKFTERNVFWYYRRDVKWAASFSPWEFRYIGKWGHYGGQRMVELTRK